jgi:hypothetical protein
MVAAIEAGVPLLIEAREIIATFQAMIRKRSLGLLDAWTERARASIIGSFANGVVKEKAAVSAAISSSWSNGQTEGADHQAQAGQAPDVRSGQNRPSGGPRCRARRCLTPSKVRQSQCSTPNSSQWVVARRPSRMPASARMKAPVQMLVVRRDAARASFNP